MIADIVVIAIIALCILLGYMRGLIKVALKIVGFIASIIIALVLYTPVSNYIINNTDIVNNLETTIQEKIYNREEKTEEEIQSVEEYIEGYTEELKENSAEYISKGLAITTVRVGTWIGLFLIARIAMIFLKIFASIMEKIPIIKQFNKVRGNNIWNCRRIYNCIHSTCNIKFKFSNNWRK